MRNASAGGNSDDQIATACVGIGGNRDWLDTKRLVYAVPSSLYCLLFNCLKRMFME